MTTNGTAPKPRVVYRRSTVFEIDIMRKQGFLRASELGQLFGVHQMTIYRWAKEHRIDEMTRGRYRYFSGWEFIAVMPHMKDKIETALRTPAGRWAASKMERVELPAKEGDEGSE